MNGCKRMTKYVIRLHPFIRTSVHGRTLMNGCKLMTYFSHPFTSVQTDVRSAEYTGIQGGDSGRKGKGIPEKKNHSLSLKF